MLEEARSVLAASHVIDLHNVMELPQRLVGYDVFRDHGVARRAPLAIGHTDLPRVRSAGFTGIAFDLTTNPARTRAGRLRALKHNVARAAQTLASAKGVEQVCSAAEYDQAHSHGKLAAFLTVQGGNALSANPEVLLTRIGRNITRVTLVHLTSSDIGGTSTLRWPDKGLTPLGAQLVEACADAGVLVDLAHAGPRTFDHALSALPVGVPPIVTHTGLDGIKPHWRNLSDSQVADVVDRGGVIGIIYHRGFIGNRRSAIIDHLCYLRDTFGPNVPAIGTDYDGFITPPRDLPDVSGQVLLVQELLERGWPAEDIGLALGGNALRIWREVRPD